MLKRGRGGNDVGTDPLHKTFCQNLIILYIFDESLSKKKKMIAYQKINHIFPPWRNNLTATGATEHIIINNNQSI